MDNNRFKEQYKTLTEQVVDPAFYADMGLQGEPHKQCATPCAKARRAFGILDRKASVLFQVIDPLTSLFTLFYNHLSGEHAQKDHGMNEIPQELVERVREAIHDE